MYYGYILYVHYITYVQFTYLHTQTYSAQLLPPLHPLLRVRRWRPPAEAAKLGACANWSVAVGPGPCTSAVPPPRTSERLRPLPSPQPQGSPGAAPAHLSPASCTSLACVCRLLPFWWAFALRCQGGPSSQLPAPLTLSFDTKKEGFWISGAERPSPAFRMSPGRLRPSWSQGCFWYRRLLHTGWTELSTFQQKSHGLHPAIPETDVERYQGSVAPGLGLPCCMLGISSLPPPHLALGPCRWAAWVYQGEGLVQFKMVGHVWLVDDVSRQGTN